MAKTGALISNQEKKTKCIEKKSQNIPKHDMKTVNTAKLYTKQCFSASMDQLSTPALLHFGQTNQNQQNPAINRRDGVRVCFSVSGGRQRGQLDAIIRPVQSSNGNQTAKSSKVNWPRTARSKKRKKNAQERRILRETSGGECANIGFLYSFYKSHRGNANNKKNKYSIEER